MSFGTISHIMPYLAPLQILAERGNRITFLAPQEYLQHINEYPGIQKRQIGSGSKQWDRNYVQDFKTIKAFDEKQNVDLFICDFMTPACLDYAHFHKKRIIFLGPLGYYGVGKQWYIPPYESPFTQDQIVSSFYFRIYKWFAELPTVGQYMESITQYEAYMKTKKELGLDSSIPKDFIQQHLFISHSVFGFHKARELPTNVMVVGPVLPSRIDPLEPELLDKLYKMEMKGMSVIYISYGSVLDITHYVGMKIFDSVVQLLNENPKLAVIIALGGSDPRSYNIPDRLLDRILIERWVNQRALLMNPIVKLFINHGGLSSIMESMYAGKPLIITPISADQFENAKKVVESDIGIAYSFERFNQQNFTGSVKQMLADFNKESRLSTGVRKLMKIARLNSETHFLQLVNTFEMAATVGYDHLVPVVAKMEWWEIYGELCMVLSSVALGIISITLYFRK